MESGRCESAQPGSGDRSAGSPGQRPSTIPFPPESPGVGRGTHRHSTPRLYPPGTDPNPDMYTFRTLMSGVLGTSRSGPGRMPTLVCSSESKECCCLFVFWPLGRLGGVPSSRAYSIGCRLCVGRPTGGSATGGRGGVSSTGHGYARELSYNVI
jgi:hypothetical protein